MVLAIGHGHANSVEGILEVDGILKHPFILPKKMFVNKKRKRIVWAHQWREWKGTATYLALSRGLKEPTDFYGLGREFYDIRSKNSKLFRATIGRDFVTDKVWNKKIKSAIYGMVHPEVITEAYKTHKAAVELTGIKGAKYVGHYNRSTLEPMLYGCVMIATRFVLDPHSHIPKDCVFPLEGGNLADIAKKINKMLDNEKKRNQITKRAFEWICENHNGKKILRKWLKKL